MHGHGPQPEGHMASHIERRKFLATVGGVATAWPLAAHAQQPRKLPRIGVLLPGTPTSFAPRTKAFVEGLQDLDLDGAFRALSNDHVQAVIVLVDGMLFSERNRIAALAAAARLPTIWLSRPCRCGRSGQL